MYASMVMYHSPCTSPCAPKLERNYPETKDKLVSQLGGGLGNQAIYGNGIWVYIGAFLLSEYVLIANRRYLGGRRIDGLSRTPALFPAQIDSGSSFCGYGLLELASLGLSIS